MERWPGHGTIVRRMDRLWSPWRMAYVTGSKRSSGCVFCIPAQPDRAEDEQRHIVYRGAHAFIILNLYPYNPGHLLIAPYRHTADLESLTAGESAEMMALAQRALRALRTDTGPQGYNMGMNLGSVGWRRYRGSLASASRPPLGGRYQLHARDRRGESAPGAIDRNGRAAAPALGRGRGCRGVMAGLALYGPPATGV